jgi:hypothetical protein
MYDVENELWLRWHGMSSKVNDPCGYKNCEIKAIIDNLVCLFIEETLSKFHQDWVLINEHDDVYEYKKRISLTMKRSRKDHAYLV